MNTFFFAAETRQRFIGRVTIAFACGAVLSALAGLFWATGRPQTIQVISVTPTKLADNGYELTVDIRVPSTPSCLRMTEHLLYTNSPQEGQSGGKGLDYGRIYLPLGTTVSGSQFQPDQHNALKLLLKIHPDTAYGQWNYVARTIFQCSAFPGLLRTREWQSDPVMITLDPRPY